MEVRGGEIFGFLGPNGAGKTTTLRMLTTLLPIDSGAATVAGYDVERSPQQARTRIGYVSQLGDSDELATGRENLVLQGRLYGDDTSTVRRRAAELIELLELEAFADRRVITSSGGQRRRLDVALGIVPPRRSYSSTSRAPGSTLRTARTCGATSARCATAARPYS